MAWSLYTNHMKKKKCVHYDRISGWGFIIHGDVNFKSTGSNLEYN